MSHEEHAHDPMAKIARMANQIATFFASKPRAEGVAGTAEHINKFWDPRMRRQLFQMLDAGGAGLHELVLAVAGEIRRPAAPEGVGIGAGADVERGAPGGKGTAAGESKAEIAASQR